MTDTNTAPTRFPGRAAKKVATAAKVVESAKHLFETVGYEKATIRAIAKGAGMSTGAVFANFTDKAALWHAIHGPDVPTPGDSNLSRNSLKMALHIQACGEQFRFYERQHRAKGTIDADQKADVNAAWAANCEAIVEAAFAPIGETEAPYKLPVGKVGEAADAG